MDSTSPKSQHHKKRAIADDESLQRIFTVPESMGSTLGEIEKEISRNIQGFLNDHIVAEELAPAKLEKIFLDTSLPDDPIFVSEQAEFLLEKVVAQSVHTASPRFIGHMTSALPYFMLPLTKLMVALNQNLVKIETSKAFTPLERQVIGMLHRLIFANTTSFYNKHTQSRDTTLGAFCSGGTIANITALWVARNRYFDFQLGERDALSKFGIYHCMERSQVKNLAVLVSKRGHYSLSKAADLLGIGKNNLIAIDIDQYNRINLNALEEHLRQLRQDRTGVIALVGIAGTTETGNVDPLAAMATIAQREGIHFHVDAAWGGPTLFSRTYKHLLSGIELADSVTFDAHKQLYVPMGAGVVLFKDPTAQDAIKQHANYIIREGSRDLGKNTLEGSRPGMAMLVHSALRVMGRKGLEMLIDRGIAKAALFAKIINESMDFELTSYPELNLLTYRFVPPHIKQKLTSAPIDFVRSVNELLNLFTVTLQKEQRAAGKSFVSRTKLQPICYGGQEIDVLRVVLANPLTTEEILRDILEEQRNLAKRLLQRKAFAQLRTMD